jgi:hypothetical protein
MRASVIAASVDLIHTSIIYIRVPLKILFFTAPNWVLANFEKIFELEHYSIDHYKKSRV